MNHEQHQPVTLGVYNPFRLVLRSDEDTWNPTIEEINKRTYDYVKLHRVSTFIDIGHEFFSIAVCFDGTLALPLVEEYNKPEKALSVFNYALCAALVGGVYCEAMSPDDLCAGTMTISSYSKFIGPSRGTLAMTHQALRLKVGGPFDSIKLFNPETVGHLEFSNAVNSGRDKLKSIGSNNAELLLYGATFYARNQRAEALLHLWTFVEGIIQAIWNNHVKDTGSVEGISTKSRKELLDNNSLWPVATKLELLYRMNLLPAAIYARLHIARKARNEFVHKGVYPDLSQVDAVLDSLFELVSLQLFGHSEDRHLISIPDLIRSRRQKYLAWDKDPTPTSPTHWLPTPPIPGDKAWGDQPYEKIDSICLMSPQEFYQKHVKK